MLQLGGCFFGGYVNDANQDNPTYEFFPTRGGPIPSPILQSTLPVNLFPLTWLLPSGNLLIQSGWNTVLLDLDTDTETPLDDIPDAVRVYPASAGTVMLPLTPANNYTATILFCGGSNVPSAKTYVSSKMTMLSNSICSFLQMAFKGFHPSKSSSIHFLRHYYSRCVWQVYKS